MHVRCAGALLWFAALCVPSGALYQEDSNVIALTQENFNEQVAESDDAFWLVEYYAPWCGHCKQLAPNYEKAAKNLNGLVKVGAVDCDAHQGLCSAAGVQSFPTLKLYPVEKFFNPYTKKSAKLPVDYKGGRSAKNIVDGVLAEMPNYVHIVQADNATTFLADDYPKALLFTDKETVSPLFKSLAVHLRGKMRLGQAQSSDTKLAEMFGVTSFPKLVAVPGTEATAAVLHEGKIKRDELVTFLDAHALKEKKQDPLLASSTPKVVTALSGEEFKEKVLGDGKKLWAVFIDSQGGDCAAGDEFKEKVLGDSKKLWAVFFHKGGKVPSAMEEVAMSIKAIQHGSVDCSKAADVCKEQDVTKSPVLRLYQEDKGDYEDFTGAATCEEDCMEPEAMTDFISDNLPEAVVIVSESTWNNFLQPAVDQPRFILVSKKEEPSLLYKSIALRYKGVLTFGYLANPSEQTRQQLQVQKMPMLMVFFMQEGEIRGGAYQGGFTWEEITRWTDQIASPFMENPEGGAPPPPPSAAVPTGPLPQMKREDGSTFEELCGSKTGLCAVAFLDGMPENEEKRQEQIKIMEDVRKRLATSPFHFSWVDATCHADFANSIDATPDKFPAMAVISPSKQRFHMHVGKFQLAELEGTLEGVLSGKKATGPYSSLAELEARQCSEVHAEIAAAMAGGGDDEDDEIMREMMEEIKRKEAEKAAEEESEKKSKKKKKKKSKK
eukprot:CAMPEP_0196760428 /NCGR_PEP_ID=MMETSP1091-20130531/105208_1 /TAXON_ID=302021 /ORGANISM="Rhodomonas sp., Strain CCMP768" /LENGTH=719 /DNA_ID=CAMNT_0042109313 /DNA_START=21 /DNA_END=2181 /DNA_ORIENTATION=+